MYKCVKIGFEEKDVCSIFNVAKNLLMLLEWVVVKLLIICRFYSYNN